MSDFLYYVNGAFVPANQAALALNDLGLVRGYGIFEVLRTYGDRPFGLRAHLDRLAYSAEQIELALPWSLDDLAAIVMETLARNAANDVTVRIVVTGGPSSNFLMPEEHPTLLVMLAPVRPYAEHFYRDGAALITLDAARFMPTVKSLNYIPAILGQRKARAAGAVEALYRTTTDHVTECTTSNFFIFRDGRLITSDVDVLDGVTRRAALDAAEDLYDIDYRLIALDELGSADEAFITSTTKEILPIVRVDDVVIGDGAVGKHTQRLMAALSALVRSETLEKQGAGRGQ